MKVEKLKFGQRPCDLQSEPNKIYIGRGTHWANPFIMRTEQDRDRVCFAFREYAKWRLTFQPDWLYRLQGKDLVCHCAPKRCHGDELVKLVKEVYENQ